MVNFLKSIGINILWALAIYLTIALIFLLFGIDFTLKSFIPGVITYVVITSFFDIILNRIYKKRYIKYKQELEEILEKIEQAAIKK